MLILLAFGSLVPSVCRLEDQACTFQLLQVSAVRNSTIRLTKTKSLSLKPGMVFLATKGLYFLVRWCVVGRTCPVTLNQRAESELAVFVEGLYEMEMLKSAAHLTELF